MILGISGSGRKNGITAKSVRYLLDSTGQNYEYISLSSKKINGCLGCTGCAEDNICVVNDDFNSIAEKMIKADAVVFGAPNYYGTINALAHACLERTYSFRHQERYKLAGKLGIALGIAYEGRQTIVCDAIEKFMLTNKMSVVNRVNIKGYSQCYDCGFGENCAVGNVVSDHGFIDKIEDCHLPESFEENENTRHKLYKTGKILGSILEARKNIY